METLCKIGLIKKSAEKVIYAINIYERCERAFLAYTLIVLIENPYYFKLSIAFMYGNKYSRGHIGPA